MPRILVFGDSIVWGADDFEKGGWTDRLKVYYLKKANPDEADFNEIYNLGNPAKTSSEILKNFEGELKRMLMKEFSKQNIIIIQTGINDSRYINSKKSVQVSTKIFEKNLFKFIKISKRYVKTLIFVSLYPLDESRCDPVSWNSDHSFKNKYVVEYERVIEQVCKKENILFIDVYSEFQKTDYKKLLSDGLHPNAKGHELIFNIVKDFIEKKKII